MLVNNIEIFLKEKKQKTSIYGRERYKNLYEHEKRRLVEYRKSYS